MSREAVKVKVAEEQQGYIHLYSYLKFYLCFSLLLLEVSYETKTHRFPNIVTST